MKGFEFQTREGRVGKIELIESADSIDQESSRRILIDSFKTEYQKYLKPHEVDSKLVYWSSNEGHPSVDDFYADYFESEFLEFKNGHLHWIQATINDRLVGWATFEKDKSQDSDLYMNLLIVDPKFQSLGVGEQLTLSPKQLGISPRLKQIHLLLRKKNLGGRAFYSRIGFHLNPNYQRENNFVDMALLEAWSLKF